MGEQSSISTLDSNDWRGGQVNLSWFTWAGETKPEEPKWRNVEPVKIPFRPAGPVVLADEDGPAAHVCLFIDEDDGGKFKIEVSRVRGPGGVSTQLSWLGEPHEFGW